MMERKECLLKLEKIFKQSASSKAPSTDGSMQLYGDVSICPGAICASARLKHLVKMTHFGEIQQLLHTFVSTICLHLKNDED